MVAEFRVSVLSQDFVQRVEDIVGAAFVKADPESCLAYGTDAKKIPHAADLVVIPATTQEVSRVAALCNERRVPLVPRGGGTGYTGGSVPVQGGVVLSLERLNRILEIDEANLLAIVQPNVITGVLQREVEQRGLFYPPDPASLDECVIGGNVAECSGGPRAFKYGTTKRYVLGLEAVLPTGEIIRTGSKAVKSVVGYDLTQLIVGSEGTLAIVTEVLLRLVPKPPVQAALRATFASLAAAVAAVDELLRRRVVPSTLELIDGESLEAVRQYVGVPLAPDGTAALLLVEVDGFAGAVETELDAVARACSASGATEILRAADEAERLGLWRVRREISPALKRIAPSKVNHDLVVPRGRVPDLFALVERVRGAFGLRLACFGHAGDGNIHVNIMTDPALPGERERVRAAERMLFEGVVGLEGSLSGEHGIGFTKAPYLGIELGEEEIRLMKRVKQAFDPNGILNPGKIFP